MPRKEVAAGHRRVHLVFGIYLVFSFWYLPSNPSGQGLLGGTPFWHSQISPDHGWIIAICNHDGENYDDEDEDPANVGNNDDT